MSAKRYVQNLAPSPEREVDDYYPTPPCGTIALLGIEEFAGPIWEPACGEGAISIVLESAGLEVVSTDLVDRGYGEARRDFLMEHKLAAPNIITNPPFKLAEQFVRHSLDLGAIKVAMLLRLAWLEGIGRKQLFAETGLTRVHVSSRRLTMIRGGTDGGNGGGSMIAFAWFVWERGHEGPVEVRFFDWADHAPAIAKEVLVVEAADLPLFK